MPGWSTQRGRELGGIKDVGCIGFGDLNVNDEERSGNPPWIIYAYIHIYRHTHMAWVIVMAVPFTQKEEETLYLPF